jgi:lysophospholipase L1-like esterase
LYLDNSEVWTRLVQDFVNARQNRIKIWIGNVGKSGHNSRHHIYQVQKLLPQYPRIDAIVLLVGINDLTLRLREDAGYVPYEAAPPDFQRQVFQMAFSLFPSWEGAGPFYKRSEIWRRLKLLKERIAPGGTPYAQDQGGNNFVTWRAHRASASELVGLLPDLTSALREYSQNLRNIVHLAAERNVRVILMTQPALWHQGLSPELAKLLWLGGIGDFQAHPGSRYYSVDSLSQAIAKYNDTVLGLCRELKVECVDLASQLPRNTDTFYDDVHFNEKGSRSVAEILSQYLLESSPFKQS